MRLSLPARSAALAALMTTPLPARADAPESAPLQVVRLDNGLTVVVHENHRLPLVALSLRYDAGQRRAPVGFPGLAELTTYAMLQATDHAGPGDYWRLLSAAGASGVTDRVDMDAVTLAITIPSRRVELPLWLWSDQMGFFEGSLDASRLDGERAALEK